jgi:CheY-like chemotaxis protein
LITPDARSRLDELKRMGFAAYLVKPVRQQSLAERVRLKTDMIVLPSREAHAPLPQTQLLNQAPAAASTNMRALRILLAEDNPINALLTRELLRRRGHVVREVGSGEAALEALAAERFDLVITDIHMPGLDGIETAERIRASETRYNRARTPILALTADALETGLRACEDAGMDGILTKPLDPAELDAVFARLFAGEARDAAA